MNKKTSLVMVAIAVMLLIVPTIATCNGYEQPEAQKSNQGSLLSSPGLGLNWNGSVAGDYIPVLYTWRDYYTGNTHTTDYYPTMYQGCVIITPARIAGEPLQDNDFWDTAKGQRILLWKANHA